MRSKALFLFLTILALGVSCKEKPGPQPFPMVQVPGMISSGKEYQNYLVTHYWQPFFKADREYSRDTALVGGVTDDAFAEAFRTYATFLVTADVAKGLQGQQYLLGEAEKMAASDGGKVLRTVLSLCDEMLYNPNSPYRTEEMYIPVEEARLASGYTTQEEKDKARAELSRLKLNRIGAVAADFPFTTREKRIMRLHDVKADYVILLFTNPGCENCRQIIELLKAQQALEQAIAAGRIAVVNIYPDAELKEWIEYAPIYPGNWYNGYNHDFTVGGGLYNLRAIPSLYLLDKDKKVILKDVDPNILLGYLARI